MNHADMFALLIPDCIGRIPDLTFTLLSADEWAKLDLAPLDAAAGWTHIEVGAPVSDDPEDGFHLEIRFSPEVLARTTEALPISSDPLSGDLQFDDSVPPAGGDEPDLGPILFADNYARAIAMVLLDEAVETEPTEELAAHQTALDGLDRVVNGDGKVVPLGLLVDKVMARALDGALG